MFDESELILYEKPACSKCQKVKKLLNEAGLSYTAINFYNTPFTHKNLENLIKKMQVTSYNRK